ncbi:MAG: hypothetical protein HQ581_24610 [Planctomycetes bacterium]|nr:hypothetical protein [Planctomycetota bacterium]
MSEGRHHHENHELRVLRPMGFVKVGVVVEDLGTVMFQESHRIDCNNLLYAFVVNEEFAFPGKPMVVARIKYLGITTTGFNRRFNGYRNAKESTDARVRSRMLTALAAGQEIEVWVWEDRRLHRFHQFRVNYAVGLEDEMIAAIAPEWNPEIERKTNR